MSALTLLTVCVFMHGRAVADAKLSGVMLQPLFSHQSRYKLAASAAAAGTHPVESFHPSLFRGWRDAVSW